MVRRLRGPPDELGAYLWRAGRSRRGPDGCRLPATLAGVPVAVKDIFCVEGLPATAGSKILEGYVPPYTATAVERLLGAGARVLGKTNMDEFAMGSSNENSAYGDVSNPWDRGAGPRRVLGRIGRRRRRRPRPLLDRAPTPAARSASPRRSAASSA